jgi:hypothetical protein
MHFWVLTGGDSQNRSGRHRRLGWMNFEGFHFKIPKWRLIGRLALEIFEEFGST